jgi:methionyl aminopeptidase
MNLFIKNEQEIAALRESCRYLAQILDEVLAQALAGVSTLELDTLAEKRMREIGGVPIFKGYGAESGRPFPGSICSSINEEVVHGIPSRDRILKDGDILKVDIGMRYQGMVSDMARSIAIGEVSAEAKRIMQVTEESLLRGIDTLKPGAKVSDYARAVQSHVEKNGFSVVRDLVGHSVGRELHEDVQIPNYVTREVPDITFVPGMTLALEPMVNAGTYEVEIASDDWTFISADDRLSAHFEDTVLITEDGVEILTRP